MMAMATAQQQRSILKSSLSNSNSMERTSKSVRFPDEIEIRYYRQPSDKEAWRPVVKKSNSGRAVVFVDVNQQQEQEQERLQRRQKQRELRALVERRALQRASVQSDVYAHACKAAASFP